MGQSSPSSQLEDWQPHPQTNSIFVNVKTGQSVQAWPCQIKKHEEPFLKKRLQQNHNFIVKIVYYEPVTNVRSVRDEQNFTIYTERMFQVCQQLWIPVTSVLSILKGFRRLSSNYGPIRVFPKMVKITQKREIRVWINQNPAKFQPQQKAEKDEQMLADILNIVIDFDAHTASLMANCYTLNEAINNILQSLPENKSVLSYSNRTSKKQQKIKPTFNIISNNTTNNMSNLNHINSSEPSKNNNNHFRSTKQTQDDSLKPFYDSQVRSKPIIQTQHSYLQNVNIMKSPAYINTSEIPSSRKQLMQKQKQRQKYNYSQQNTNSKQSSIQFNNSQPNTNTNNKQNPSNMRPFKPIQYRNQNQAESIYSYNPQKNQNSPNYQQNTIQKDNVFRTIQHYPGRQSNINKGYLERLQNSQDSSLPKSSNIGKDSLQGNDRSEINTSRDFKGRQIPYHHNNINNNKNANNIYFDANRTKTQQFYSSGSDLIGQSLRLKTNSGQYSQITKPAIAQSSIYSHTPLIESKQKQIKLPSKQQTQSLESSKKLHKLKQAQTIKQQMGCLGIVNNNKRQLVSEKSARDLLIKQKVQEKNKKHEDLKFAITRLLND